ncbi:septum formation protein [Hypnocyclicus thermotrophus]|uniref:dTTP/UTP pyrophosphatase n=1 Tax=Hypnocyclicus thermotrophus TaxID=1627895 RepID=A0AA46DXW7_9FUSO|nr:Maf family protein [Hypnocyclicus thermotrophus]TDT69118.1 septum formation protein [Hypnocyclicus thermotrophus]
MILASKSPRRKEILEKIFKNIDIKTKEVEEVSDKNDVLEQIMDIANKKAIEVAKQNKTSYILAADTVVVYDNMVLGKPQNKEEAKKYLKMLSGNTHNVITAYSFLNIEKNIKILNYEITKVTFKKLDNELIKWYINQGEPLDKAGAYGIQEKGNLLVEKIEGDFYNVMGFPLSKFVSDLREKLLYDLLQIENL